MNNAECLMNLRFLKQVSDYLWQLSISVPSTSQFFIKAVQYIDT